ncbi:hypothetical protein FRB97_008517 [Tulasnella sp. 331]|nr:hypothetical protein FRB97_008517 [Tulasnella sp. 331]
MASPSAPISTTNINSEALSRPFKHARFDPADYSTYAKDPNFYLSDGTICLAVEQTIFKVHQSILARHSTVFRDMFNIPPPPNDGDDTNKLEGSLVIKLDDASADVRVLFGLMYDTPPIEVPLAMLESVFRLAHKYNAEQYEAWCIAWIKKYPSAGGGMVKVYKHPKWLTYNDPHDAARLIKMTEVLNMRELDGIATVAYYALSIANWEAHNQGNAFHRLQPAIFTRLGKGQARIHSQNNRFLMSIVSHNCTPTKSNNYAWVCRRGKELALQTLIPRLTGDFIAAVNGLMSLSDGSACDSLQSIYNGAGEKLFRNIPIHFGFELPAAGASNHAFVDNKSLITNSIVYQNNGNKE